MRSNFLSNPDPSEERIAKLEIEIRALRNTLTDVMAALIDHVPMDGARGAIFEIARELNPTPRQSD
jgi:hypothetical protein